MRSHVYIIAEIGINHNADIAIAKRLIDIAAFAGCDAVKFQKRTPELCTPKDQWDVMKDTPWGKMRYIDYKYKMEFDKKDYDEIDKHCKDRGIDWSVSVWDMPSLWFARQYDLPFIKVPSAMLTNDDLIMEVARSQKERPILSCGMSTEDELCKALELMYLANEEVDPVVMQCNSSYPAKVEELNLLYITELTDKYGVEAGYSGHEFGLVTTFAAVALGATFIERHITIDRTLWGTDQLASVEPTGLIKLVKGVRDIELALGDGIKRVYPSELEPRKKLRGC